MDKEKAGFICVKDTIDGAVVWTAEDFLRYAKDCKICLFT